MQLHQCACIAAVITSAACAAAPVPPSQRPWLDATRPVGERVTALLSAMTLEEKVNQLLHPWTTVTQAALLEQFGATGVGSVYMFSSADDEVCRRNLTCRLAARNALQTEMIKRSRLGIPVSFVGETLHSVKAPAPQRRRVATAGDPPPTDDRPLSTVFPMPNSQGATWNRSLVEVVNVAVALEARAVGVDRAFSPEIQVAVDPRFGRMEENYGADPWLVSQYAYYATVGLGGGRATAGPDAYLGPTRVVVQGKHFAAYAAGGFDGAPADVSQATLYNVYLRPWRAFIAAGGRGVMAAHNSVNAQPCHASSWLLTKVLREELGCATCFVGSDFNDIPLLNMFGVTDPKKYPDISPYLDAAIHAIEAGLDMELGAYGFPFLRDAVERNLTGLASIDRAARNILRTKFAAGLFDAPVTDAGGLDEVHASPHVRYAREAATQGCVLLRNPPRGGRPGAAGPLPLATPSRGRPRGTAADPLRIALLGPNAGCTPTYPPLDGVGVGSARARRARGPRATPTASLCDVSVNMAGGYAPSNLAVGQVVTLQDALDAEAGVVYDYARGVDADSTDTSGIAAAVALAKQPGTDAVVLVLGDSSTTCGEAMDRVSLDLPGKQLDLLQAVLDAVDAATPVVAVVVNCRTFAVGEGVNSKFGPDNAMLRTHDNLAVLAAYRPGEQGGVALADLLLGRVQPSGRAAQPYPRSAGHINSWSTPWFHLRQGDYGGSDGGTPWPLVGGETYDPLWCFGHGLSYSTFDLTALELSPTVVPAPTSSDVFTNISVAVAEVYAYPAAPAAFTLQVYFEAMNATQQVRPRRMLVGSHKVWLERPAAASPQHVSFPLLVSDFGYTVWDGTTQAYDFIVEPGQYRVYACRSSCDCPLNTTLTIV